MSISDMRPIHIDGADCLNHIYMTLCNYWNRRYEPTFSNQWDFHYEQASNKKNVYLGAEIRVVYENDLEDLFEKYCGITTEKLEFSDFHNFISQTENELSNDRPIGIAVNTFWCPWNKDYQLVERYHMMLIVGLRKDGVLCIDSYNNLEINVMPYSLLENSICGAWKYGLQPIIEIDDIGGFLIESMQRAQNSPNEIRLFAKAIYSLNIKQEYSVYNPNIYSTLWDVLLNRKLDLISGSRNMFSLYLKYMSEKDGYNFLASYVPLFIELSNKWNKVKMILLKCYLTEFRLIDREKLLSYINDIAACEESVRLSLVEKL